MEKFCLFCGKLPKSKSMEHVIPRWLIELTGEPKRKISLGINFNKPSEPLREYSFNSFRFPSCANCNHKFSELEDNASLIIKSMIAKEPINSNQISILLDWLDKVRIGLWLSFLYLDHNPFGIVPNFYISGRIRVADRMVAIYHADNNWHGINFIGINTPAFWLLPSCFNLVINDIYLFNISAPFLFSRRIGFPYPKSSFILQDKRTLYEIYPGLERFIRPIIRRPFLKPCKEIYQPIFGDNEKVRLSANNLYDIDYVHKNCSNWEKGIGKIFIQDGSKVRLYPNEKSLDWFHPEVIKREYLHFNIGLQVFGFQNYLMKLGPSDEKLLKQDRVIFKYQRNLAKEFNNDLIKDIKLKLRKSQNRNFIN